MKKLVCIIFTVILVFLNGQLPAQKAGKDDQSEWRSSLYPTNWKPGYKDSTGRYLHDFSYAGYHQGECDIPDINSPLTDITRPPYNADNTGIEDVTLIIQQALDDVGSAGGGVVYLPAGSYRIKTPGSSDYGLHIKYNSVILRGAGADSTFIFHDQTYMRQKDIIHVRSHWSNWFDPEGSSTEISADLTEPTRIIPVNSISGFSNGSLVVLSSYPTEQWIAEHLMAGIWTPGAVHGVAFLRRIDSIDAERNLLIIDSPIRYYLKTRDNSSVYHAGRHITECGIEHLSIGNSENPKTGWDEESYSTSGTGAYDVHFSHAIQFKYAHNCWVRNVKTYRPGVNEEDIHILSNCLQLNACRNITVDSCDFQKPQYEGGGGNGYMYTLQSNDCLIKNCRANHSRHNYDFKYPFSNGNVIHNCRGENSKYSSDFHMYLSMSNLIDLFTVNSDYLESDFRPYGGSAIHGYSSTQSVFYNTAGENYHSSKSYIIESKQFGWGYVIGTSGPASGVLLKPASGSAGGYAFDTNPVDFLEGEGQGGTLRPWSLYLDQLQRRLNDTIGIHSYNVTVRVRDEETGDTLPGSLVNIYGEQLTTGSTGIANYSQVPESFLLSVEKEGYLPWNKKQVTIYSDTTITICLAIKLADITVRLTDRSTGNPMTGINVTLGQVTNRTNSLGEVFFNLLPGDLDYHFYKSSYREEQGTITVSSYDTTIAFEMIRTHAYARFELKEDDSPVYDALVVLNEDSARSSAIGVALFRDLPVETNYTYSILMDGYSQQDGDFFLETDTTIQVFMIPDHVFDRSKNPDYGILCWPNPGNDFMYINIAESNQTTTIRITDITGHQVSLLETENRTAKLDISFYPAGIYLIQISSDEVYTCHPFVKN